MSDQPDHLGESRAALALALRKTQEGVRRALGVRTARRAWLLPLVAAGVGLTLALALRKRRAQISSGDRET